MLISLLISALSTLDSAMASASRLTVEELRLAPKSLWGGRIAMVVFMALGTGLTLWGNATLFDAVAVSGTASMFLTPVLFATLVLRRSLPTWAYLVSFSAAMIGAIAYFARESAVFSAILPDAHKYTQLLAICVCVLAVGFAAVLVAGRQPAVRVASKA